MSAPCMSKFKSGLGILCLWLISAMFFLTSLGKFFAIDEFMISLDSWALLPKRLIPLVGMLVPATELVLALMFFVNHSRRKAVLGMIVLLCVFSVVYAMHMIVADPPNCSCIGKWEAFQALQRDGAAVLVRNGVLISIVVFGLLATRTTGEYSKGFFSKIGQPQKNPSLEPPATNGQHGFSLLELMLIISIVGVLAGLLLPALVNVRDRARELRAMSDLSQHAKVMTLYTNDWKEMLPFVADPDATLTIARSEQFVLSFEYFSTYSFWAYPLIDSYYPGVDPTDEIFVSPLERGQVFENNLGTVYYYSCSLIASPEYWDTNTRQGRNQFKPTKIFQVRYPSAKTLLAVDPWFIRDARSDGVWDHAQQRYSLMAAVDGHSSRVIADQMTSPIRHGDRSFSDDTVGGHLIGLPPSGMHTKHGHNGRDVK